MSCSTIITDTPLLLFVVGQVVRAPFRSSRSRSTTCSGCDPAKGGVVRRRRAVIATLNQQQQPQEQQDDDDDDDNGATIITQTACLLWEDEAPQQQQQCLFPQGQNNSSTTTSSSSSSNHGSKRKCRKKRFLLAPSFEVSQKVDNAVDDAEEGEATVPISDLSPLLDFEVVVGSHVIDKKKKSSSKDENNEERGKNETSVKVWKNRGDQLLRLGDAAAAVSFYEMALQLSSVLEVGGRVLLRRQGGGGIVVGEVDCVEEQDGTVDITIPKTGQERTMDEEQILLCVLEGDEEEQLQERILLNLSRCFLQLAEITTVFSRRPAYLQSAYLACSLAICINSLREENDNLNKGMMATTRTALLLRSQAYASLGKHAYAIADMKRLLKLDPQHKEAKRRLRDFEQQKVEQAKNEKKLVKEVCRWVQNATNESSSVSETTTKSESSADETGQSVFKQDVKRKTTWIVDKYISLLLFLMAVVVAWIVQKQFP